MTPIMVCVEEDVVSHALCNTSACIYGPIWIFFVHHFLSFRLNSFCFYDMTTHSTQPNMLKTLSFDLLCKTFSLLPRNDILECMLVSRQWRDSIPHYASECFAHLVLKNDHNFSLYSRLLEYVGTFTKIVVLEHYAYYFESLCMMTVLIPRYFVNVSTLRKWIHIEYISNGGANDDIDIHDCCIPQELGILLSQLPSLSQLKILRPTSISLSSAFIRSILYYCPWCP